MSWRKNMDALKYRNQILFEMMFTVNFVCFRWGIATLTLLSCLSCFSHAAVPRTTIFMPIPSQESWQDMAFLAAVPAATVVNNGALSLIALHETGESPPEILDYTKRYRPERVILLDSGLGGSSLLAKSCERIKVTSADDAACRLSQLFWPISKGAIICSDDHYESVLVASTLAAHLRVPLLFTSKQQISPTCAREIRRLKIQNIVAVGSCGDGVRNLQKEQIKVTELANGLAVFAWMKDHKLPVDYVAVVNPQDRDHKVIRKMSMAGVMLAAGRRGLVMPLTVPCYWRTPFGAVEMTGAAPVNIPKTECPPRVGKISISGGEVDFIVTENKDQKDPKVYVDLNRDGSYALGTEGPFVTGDTIKVGNSRHVITLNSDTGVRVAGKSDVQLSGPPVPEVVGELNRYYAALGTVPEYLCLAGFPDTIPHEISNGTICGKDVVSDLPFSNADEDPFAEICVARMVAEDISSASLYASRVLTYSSLLAPDWDGIACQALWENTLGELFENARFKSNFRHTREDLKWKVPPAADGSGGEKEATISQKSPLAHCSLIAHCDHSWWREIGAIFRLDAKVLLSPTVVESGGCATGALDGEEDFKTVIPRLFRNGAVSYVGNARNGAATAQIQRMEFWTNVLDGMTVGQAHRRSINSALGTVLNKDQDSEACYLYQLRIRTLYGDPAFRPHIPGKKKIVGAHITLAKDIVTVHAPATWWTVKMVVPSDWAAWVNKDLYVLRGEGTYSKSDWGNRQRNHDQTCYTAEFTTRRPVAEIKQLGNPPAPLGMLGKWQVDVNSDGSSTYRWVVRLADFDQEKGKITAKYDHFDYQIVFK